MQNGQFICSFFSLVSSHCCHVSLHWWLCWWCDCKSGDLLNDNRSSHTMPYSWEHCFKLGKVRKRVSEIMLIVVRQIRIRDVQRKPSGWPMRWPSPPIYLCREFIFDCLLWFYCWIDTFRIFWTYTRERIIEQTKRQRKWFRWNRHEKCAPPTAHTHTLPDNHHNCFNAISVNVEFMRDFLFVYCSFCNWLKFDNMQSGARLMGQLRVLITVRECEKKPTSYHCTVHTTHAHTKTTFLSFELMPEQNISETRSTAPTGTKQMIKNE